ncbi:hypothetical protein Q5424_09330 [Conexibacter sp. JD483]|uniref:hypothetical protein n=1 Tax=unclassified Conexibacter TaxID=2627773 RepID=UPI00271CCF7E|nr:MULTISPECIES: hypothetical protein [unclassified Conexibacter]MDO8187222.1 hypothetical protein [Conexibacter sp. CPCC 205706]MDO8199319.1 hypothetical protein [Conexibacter sp. CPCC 205762]MDR9369280.1 hypothetical protein [Conexibacter sp. JD483]
MPASPSRRMLLSAPTGGDRADVPTQLQKLRDRVDEIALTFAQGTLANRPPARTAGRIYVVTSTGQLFYDTGSAWRSPVTEPQPR